MDLAHTALAEVHITHREGLVHQQNFGVDMDGNGESEAHDHPAGVGLDGLIDEVADLCESSDLVEAAVHFPIREAEDGSIQINIVATGKLRIETGAQF